MDLRIKKTYRALFDAFTELLEEHRFEDLTVAMLCDRALIRRIFATRTTTSPSISMSS